MNASNCLEFRSLATMYNDLQLVEAANLFITRNFEAVSKTDDFLSTITFNEFIEILAQEIVAKNEDVIASSISNWIYQKPERVSCLLELSKLVDWEGVSESLKAAFKSSFPELPIINPPDAIFKRKACSKLLISIGFDSQDVECLDLSNIQAGWRVLTK